MKQEARFEFSQIQASPDTVAVGEESNITCSLYNLGRVKMYNVKVRFEGDAIEGQEQFIGNLDSGSTGTIDGIVTAVEESYEESNCKLVLTYEEDAGKVSTVEQEFTMTVNAVEEIMDMGMSDMTEEEHGSPVPGILLAAAAVIVIGIILAAVLIKTRRKKKLAEEEEELRDEVEGLTVEKHQQPKEKEAEDISNRARSRDRDRIYRSHDFPGSRTAAVHVRRGGTERRDNEPYSDGKDGGRCILRGLWIERRRC